MNTKKADGLFLASCLDHTGDVGAAMKTTVEGTTFISLVGDWGFDRNCPPTTCRAIAATFHATQPTRAGTARPTGRSTGG